MDPELHDEPMYTHMLAWSIAITFGVVGAYWLVYVVGETVEHFVP